MSTSRKHMQSCAISKAIGIDLGTTSSCVGVRCNSYGVEIMADDQGNRTSLSYVSFSDNKSPEEILSTVLLRICRVPPLSSSSQAAISAVNILQISDMPTATAIAYGLDKKVTDDAATRTKTPSVRTFVGVKGTQETGVDACGRYEATADVDGY
ncbi:hypothetical protein B0H14DRAFT_3517081 [Mycena olivaceomarginata]|nr:hypothetical protein B0H14DRAFT_3517081 [Mycena olivaceomarginata]